MRSVGRLRRYRLPVVLPCLAWLCGLATLGAAEPQTVQGQALALRFTSAHGGLYRSAGDVLAAGDPYPCISWCRTPAFSVPTSHTAGAKAKISALLSFSLAGLPEDTPCVLEGSSEEPALCFRQAAVLQASPLLEVEVTASQPLGPMVRKLQKPIRWQLLVQPPGGQQQRVDLGTTGPHVVYALLGPPKWVAEPRSVPTEARLDLVVQTVAAAQAKGGLTAAEPWLVWEMMRTHVETYLPTRHYPREQAWKVPESWRMQPKGASCISIVEFVGLVAKMAGMEGEVSTTAFHARPPNPRQAQRGGLGDPPIKKRGADGEPWQLFLVDHHNTRSGQVGGQGGMNYYEAVLEFKYRGQAYYYPGGTDRVYDSGEKVLSIFRTLAWAAYDWNLEDWVVREVVETYSQPGDKPVLSVPLPR